MKEGADIGDIYCINEVTFARSVAKVIGTDGPKTVLMAIPDEMLAADCSWLRDSTNFGYTSEAKLILCNADFGPQRVGIVAMAKDADTTIRMIVDTDVNPIIGKLCCIIWF